MYLRAQDTNPCFLGWLPRKGGLCAAKCGLQAIEAAYHVGGDVGEYPVGYRKLKFARGAAKNVALIVDYALSGKAFRFKNPNGIRQAFRPGNTFACSASHKLSLGKRRTSLPRLKQKSRLPPVGP